MRAEEVPASLLAIRCLRCADVLAVDPDLPRERRDELALDHHLYMCAAPTPNVRLWREAGFPEASRPTPRRRN